MTSLKERGERLTKRFHEQLARWEMEQAEKTKIQDQAQNQRNLTWAERERRRTEIHTSCKVTNETIGSKQRLNSMRKMLPDFNGHHIKHVKGTFEYPDPDSSLSTSGNPIYTDAHGDLYILTKKDRPLIALGSMDGSIVALAIGRQVVSAKETVYLAIETGAFISMGKGESRRITSGEIPEEETSTLVTQLLSDCMERARIIPPQPNLQ